MPTLAKPDRRGVPANAQGRRRSWWWWGRHALTLAFVAVVVLLLAEQVSKIDWGKVLQSLREYTAWTLAAAAALTVFSHLLFGGFDQLGRRYVGHALRPSQVAVVAGICYAFTLNMGALIGGIAFRYRLYSRLGLAAPDITKVYALSVLSNWLGYLILLGTLLLAGAVHVPPRWGIPAGFLPVLGVACWALVAGYGAMCAGVGRRRFVLKGVAIEWPGWRMALVQGAMSIANWLIMGLIIHLFMGGRVDYPTVLGVMLLSAVAGALTHVPAGLGVLEAVFLTLLAGKLPAYEILAALLAYRAIYYLCPLVPAVAAYAVLEARARR
ncbi:UPF0104 family protein [Pigmentiphaga sp. H8]|nr:UPF0104 family protein [Pigmentiphaga sp. H8]